MADAAAMVNKVNCVGVMGKGIALQFKKAFPENFKVYEGGLKALVREVRQRKIRSIAFPPLGAGLGGLQWSRVKGMIKTAFADMPDVRVKLYEPKGSPEAKDMPVVTAKPRMTVARGPMPEDKG